MRLILILVCLVILLCIYHIGVDRFGFNLININKFRWLGIVGRLLLILGVVFIIIDSTQVGFNKGFEDGVDSTLNSIREHLEGNVIKINNKEKPN